MTKKVKTGTKLKQTCDRSGSGRSRAAPVLGPMAEQGIRVAMADPACQETIADQRTPWAMAEKGTPWAMAGSPPKNDRTDPLKYLLKSINLNF